jgi:beta-galactosidase
MNTTDRFASLNLPSFPYGAVYFRKSNPPKEDWDRDYRKAAEDGMNAFRHWFMWNAIEVAPGEFDWDDYDQQLELGAKYGIKAIIAECTHSAPEWVFHKYPNSRFLSPDGTRVVSHMRDSSATGGFPGLCYDNEDVKELAANFLRQLASRYKDHPGMAYYDVWNENNLKSSGWSDCRCAGTVEKFRAWLKKKYGDVRTMGKVWHRYSFTGWEQVFPPSGGFREAYQENLDWVDFRIENTYELFKWRVETIRSVDKRNVITSHGVGAGTLHRMVVAADDVWKCGEQVDFFGYTGGCAFYDRYLDKWRRFSFPDLARAGARGKPFWAAEMAAGPYWTGRQGFARETGRVPTEKDVRLANFIGMACGVKGIFSARWRPLLHGPLFDHIGYYAMDGSSTVRSEMASRIAKWANAPAQKNIWLSNPVKGDVGILVVPESEIYSTLQQRNNSDHYHAAVQGAYQAFLDNNIQADYVHPDDLDAYDFLYLPHPFMLPKAVATKLINWVEKGGILVSEGCPGYFGDNATAGTVQPNHGLDKLFGAKQEAAEFMADILGDLTFRFGDRDGIHGGIYTQTYKTTTGRIVGWFKDGREMAVENAFGKGKTLLVGTIPGAGYYKHQSEATRAFFLDLLSWAGRQQLVTTGSPTLMGRLHSGAGGTTLWLINNSPNSVEASVSLSSKAGKFAKGSVLWGELKNFKFKDQTVSGSIPSDDALVIKLES